MGKAVAVDSTTLEANAALETLRRKDTGESYREFVLRLAEEAGEQIATVGERIEYDRGRPGKSLSNKDWESKTDPDAKVAKMKDGGTDMAHKAEHVVDLESGALLGVTVQGAELGDTQTLGQTLAAAEAAQGEKPAEVAADKGYHSDATLQALAADGQESYVPEPKRKRNWDGKEEVQKTVEANRERVERGARPGVREAADREGGAVDGPHVRERRAAAGVLAGTRKHPEAFVNPRLRIQSGHLDAVADGGSVRLAACKDRACALLAPFSRRFRRWKRPLRGL